MEGRGMLFPDIAERRWRQMVHGATEKEQRWIAEALPKEILDAEVKRRSDRYLANIQEYVRNAIIITEEEQRRIGAI